MFPFIPTTAESPDLEVRVRRLEDAMALALSLQQLLLEQLEANLGPGFLGEELGRLVDAGGSDVREEVERIDALVRQGQKPTAARVFRELAGVTWDQAHVAIGRWNLYPLEQKVRWLQLARWVKALGSPPVAPGSGPGEFGT